MTQMKTMIALTVLLFSGNIFANQCTSDVQAETECCEMLKSLNQTKVSRLPTRDKRFCTLSVYNGDSSSGFRRFGFANDGQVSIFMQPGGNSQKSNSSQSFLIFPFGELPTGKFDADQRKLNLKSGSGQKWTFNSETSLPNTLEGCTLNVSSKFSLQDSGVKIHSCKKHLVIETPVEVGGEHIAYPDKLLTLRDPSGKSCQLKNSDLYEYIKEGKSYKDKLGRYFNSKFRFRTNQELAGSLRKLCPGLDVSMLMTAAAPSAGQIESADEKRARDILNGNTKN